MATEAEVTRIPPCDLCGDPAEYDALTKMGSWGYLCRWCYGKWGVGLGTGRGQRLVLIQRGHPLPD